MKRAILFAAIPIAMVGAGLYGMLFIPDVATAKTVIEHSSLGYLALVLFGGMFGMLAAMLWDTTR